MNPTHCTTIVIIGAGYAGVMAANRIAAHPQVADLVHVHLINPLPYLVERVRLHEALCEDKEPIRPLSELLNPAIDVVVDRATSIDRKRSIVHLSDGGHVPFDRVVLATGSAGPAPAGAWPISVIDDLQPLRDELLGSSHKRIRVVGGGLTGIETAAELAYQGLDVEIVDSGTIGSHLGRWARKQASRELRRLGCTVIDNHVCQPEPDLLTIWAAGFAPVTVPCDPPVTTSLDGRIMVNRYLRSPDDPRIIAIGDCAACPAPHLRPSCASALSLGAVAADILISELLKGSPPDTGVGYVMHCVSLGRRRAVVEHVSSNDVPHAPILTGRTARRVKDWVMDRTIQWLIEEARHSGSYRIVRGPAE